ncbi:MAG TPA: hypothetical protein VGJ77_01220 [Gaiellaceae bacterium]|jgi:hypothetical protein
MGRTPRFVTKLAYRIAREDGIALVMSLSMMTVLGIVGATTVLYSTQNAGAASRSRQDGVSYALAEAGVNNAAAALGATGVNPLNAGALPQRTTEYDGGSVTWWGTLNEGTGVWTFTSVGRTRNPTGRGAADVTRTVTAQAQVLPAPAQPLSNPAWNYIYARQKGLTCDMTLSNSVQVTSPLYVNGNLCLQNTASIAKGPLVVNGRLTMTQTANAAGSAAAPLSEAHIAGGCKWTSGLLHTPCLTGAGTSGADNVWATRIDGVAQTITPPTPAFDYWYQNANPGPFNPCRIAGGTPPVFDNDTAGIAPDGTKRNNSLNTAGAIDLTPPTSYTCKTAIGELSWNASTRVLTIAGTVFIDGSAKVGNGSVNSYTGMGTLYLSGTLSIKSAKLCAVVTGDGSGCTTDGWDPNQKMLVVVANGNGSAGGAAAQVLAGDSVQLVSSHFQGAVYGTWAIDLDTTSKIDGPLDGSTLKLGNSSSSSFPSISFVPVGTPGITPVLPRLGPVSGFSG